MTTLTRGPLPAEVYWRRRLIVLTVALLLVVGIARLLGGGSSSSDGPGAAGTAADVAATTTRTTAPTPSATAAASETAEPTGRQAKKARRAAEATAAPPPPPSPTLLDPVGACADEDVLVTPSVTGAQASVPVTIGLTLRTLTNPACTWRMSPESLAVKITSGRDRIYTTTECPRLVPTSDVVVRRDVDTLVTLAWTPRRSDEECSRHTAWADPGYYHVSVAALGGEPASVQFELGPPPAPPAPPAPTATPAAATQEGDPVKKRQRDRAARNGR